MLKIMENPMNKWMIWGVFPYFWVDTHVFLPRRNQPISSPGASALLGGAREHKIRLRRLHIHLLAPRCHHYKYTHIYTYIYIYAAYAICTNLRVCMFLHSAIMQYVYITYVSILASQIDLRVLVSFCWQSS